MLKETDIPSFEYIEEVYFGRKWMSAYGYPTDEYDYDFDMYYIKCSHCRKTYTEYEKQYTYSKTTNLESDTQVNAGSDISNVQKWVQYRAK